jgi:hypothetical protein
MALLIFMMNSRCWESEPGELWLRWGQGMHLKNSWCRENEPSEMALFIFSNEF